MGSGPSWSWSYGSWINNYLCNQCLSPLWVRTLLSWGELDTTVCDKVSQWLATGRWFSLGSPVSSTNKTDRRDITEILLKLESHIKHHQPKPIWGQMKNERAIVILSGSKMTCCKCVSSLEQNLSSDGSFFYLHPYFHILRKSNALLSDI